MVGRVGLYGRPIRINLSPNRGFRRMESHGLLFFPLYYCIMEENVQKVKGQTHVDDTSQSKR